MVEDAISGMDEQFERMWHGLSSFSSNQQQVIKTLELGVSAGESRMDTMRGMIGSRPDGLNHAISAPTVWGTVALVFDKLEGQMADVATNATGLSEEAVVELVNDIIARAKSDLASVEDIQSLKRGTREALSSVARKFEELERTTGGGQVRDPQSVGAAPEAAFIDRIAEVETQVKNILSKTNSKMIQYGGINVSTGPEMAAFLDEHNPGMMSGLVVDAHLFFKRMYHEMFDFDTLTKWEKSKKLHRAGRGT
jgi:hypothetical protein